MPMNELRLDEDAGRVDGTCMSEHIERLRPALIARHGIQITADPATNAQDAYEEVWIAFSPQIETAMDNVADNDLIGIEQMDQFRLDRAAAIDSVCPAFSNSEKVFQNAQREDQSAWLQAHPDVAQRVADEWADGIIRLQAILDAQPS
jgi:hypothetical protein